MRTIRIYYPTLCASQVPTLSKPEQHRLKNVLRAKTGTPIELFNGQGLVLKTTLDTTPSFDSSKKGERGANEKIAELLSLNVKDEAQHMPPLQLSIHYGLALTKGERFDWALQKLTELGVRSITPLICAHNEVRLNSARMEKKLQQWLNILIAASEQCGLNWLPELNPPTDINAWLKSVKHKTQRQWVLTPHASNNTLFTKQSSNTMKPNNLAIVSGPEGGLSETEVKTALDYGFDPIKLGPRILRAETAPICGLTLAQFLWGDTLS